MHFGDRVLSVAAKKLLMKGRNTTETSRVEIPIIKLELSASVGFFTRVQFVVFKNIDYMKMHSMNNLKET
jgi:hypothetical protein